MISRLRGILSNVTDQSAFVDVGGLTYEVMVPSGLVSRLRDNGSIGTEVQFDTIYYIEAGDKKSNEYPRLVGFLNPIDREFFSLWTQVPGLGVKKALKSLVLPIKEIASAVETKDSGTLSRLPGVGARLSEKIIAELHGKTTKFALSREEEPLAVKEKTTTPFAEEATAVLVQLQYKPHEAQQMIQAALKTNPKVDKVEDLITLIFRLERESKVYQS
jgi:Holliday junction DNA helicase RuvA